MLSGPLAFHTVASRLVTEVNGRLTDTPGRVGVVPGAIAWDGCDCGLLAAAVGRMFPAEVFPQEPTAAGVPCQMPYLVAEVVLNLIRCAPGPGESGEPPTVTALDSAAQVMAADGHHLEAGVSCLLAEMKGADDLEDYLVRPLVPLGPTGNCVGWQASALVAVWR